MFWKKVNLSSIKNFTEALQAVKYLIKNKKWETASHIIHETKIKEKSETERQLKILGAKELNKDDFHTKKTILLQRFENNITALKKQEEIITKIQTKTAFIPASIKKYSDAIKSINTLIVLKEWEKWKKSILEVKNAEKAWLDDLLWKLEEEWDTFYTRAEKRKQLHSYNKKEKQLNTLLDKITEKQREYNENATKKKFKVRFAKIKWEINFLIKTWKAQQALKILKSFLEENKEKSIVIKFYNKEKSRLLKSIEKQKIAEEKKIKRSLKEEAMKLAGTTVYLEWIEDHEDTEKSFLDKLKNHFDVYHKIKEWIRKKRLKDEVNILINESKAVSDEITEKRLANAHKWLVKEIYSEQLEWYELYWKILGADKISWDTFWLHEWKWKFNLVLGDATGHWIKAGLIITLLTRLFDKHVEKKNIRELLFEINNGLKQELQSRNFITWILFQVDLNNMNYMRYVGFWHEPMLIYRKESKTIDHVIPWGLAAWIRMIPKLDQVKEKSLKFHDWDILLTYSDGIIEAKSPTWDFYWLDRLKESFLDVCNMWLSPRRVYKHLMDTLVLFRWWTAFDDDATILLVQRDIWRDVQSKDSQYLKTLQWKEKLQKKDIAKLVWKNKKQINKELEKIKREKELNLILDSLKKLYHIWEFITLKQESIRHIKDWWVHKEINFYLKKAIDNESKYKIGLKNKKIANRYNLLEQLYKKWDYDTVIREVEEIIAKEWEI